MNRALELSHPNLIEVIDISNHNNIQYFVTRYFFALILRKYLINKSLMQSDKIEIIYKIAKGLEHAHQNNIFHLNINDENIIIDENSNLKIINLGITSLLD